MRGRVLALRAPLLAAYAAALLALAYRSSLETLLPFPTGLVPFGLYVYAGLLAALLPALFARASPLPGMLAVLVPVALVASYDESHLDWLRVLKDFHVAAPGSPDPLRLALALAALALAWATHVADFARRLGDDLAERGVGAAEVRAARRLVARRAGRVALAAALGALAAGALAFALARVPLPTERGAFLMPLLAALLVALGAGLLAWGTRDERAT